METYASTLNKARDMAWNNDRNCYVYNDSGWCTTFVELIASSYGEGGKYTIAYPNGKWEKVGGK